MKGKSIICVAVIVAIVVIIAVATVVMMNGNEDDDRVPSANELQIVDGTYNYEMIIAQDGFYYPTSATLTFSNNLLVHAEIYSHILSQSELDEFDFVFNDEYMVSVGPEWTDGSETVGTYQLSQDAETFVIGENGYLLYGETSDTAGQLILKGWSPLDGSIDRIAPDMTLADGTLYFDAYMLINGDYFESYAVITIEGGDFTYFEMQGKVMPQNLLDGFNEILNDIYSPTLGEGEAVAISHGGSWTNGSTNVQSYRLDIVNINQTDPIMEMFVSTGGELLYLYINSNGMELELFQQGWNKGIA